MVCLALPIHSPLVLVIIQFDRALVHGWQDFCRGSGFVLRWWAPNNFIISRHFLIFLSRLLFNNGWGSCLFLGSQSISTLLSRRRRLDHIELSSSIGSLHLNILLGRLSITGRQLLGSWIEVERLTARSATLFGLNLFRIGSIWGLRCGNLTDQRKLGGRALLWNQLIIRLARVLARRWLLDPRLAPFRRLLLAWSWSLFAWSCLAFRIDDFFTSILRCRFLRGWRSIGLPTSEAEIRRLLHFRLFDGGLGRLLLLTLWLLLIILRWNRLLLRGTRPILVVSCSSCSILI